MNARIVYDGKHLEILDENGQTLPYSKAQITITRPRASSHIKGDKIISKCEADVSGFSTNRAVYDNYDVVYAIDTNTKQISDCWFSVGALVKLIKFEEEENNIFDYEIKRIRFITSTNKEHKANIEQWVWLKVIELIREAESAEKKIGLVVDCDLGNIDKYNNKEMKICNQSFVPDNITLIYASADNKNSNILTIMIATADKFASEQLKVLCKN